MSPAAAPWLSVIMPVYDGAATLGDALRSIAAEGDPGIEVVVVDDGSSDSSVEVARSVPGLSPVVLTPGRLGSWTAATNAGLAVATAAWTCFLHQDDYWLPGRAAALRSAIADCPEASLIVGPTAFVDDAGAPLGPWSLPWRGAAPAAADVAARLWVQNWLSVPSACFPTTAARDGGLDTDLWYTADWDLWLRLVRAGGPVVALAAPTVAFRVHGGSQTVLRSGDAEGFRAQHTTVQERHAWAVPAAPVAEARLVRRAGTLSTDVNVFLAGLAHGGGLKPALLPRSGDPRVWRRYLRDSRISERLRSRVRLGLAARKARRA